MSYRSFKYAVLMAPFFLTACGDNFTMEKTTEYFPYGNQRTAGSGVAYVVAKMMPEKELKLEPATPVVEEKSAPVEETKEILEEMDEPKAKAEEDSMEELFEEALKK